MDFWILPTFFCHTYKIHGYGLLFYNVLISCVLCDLEW
jgi:hypothetical protein